MTRQVERLKLGSKPAQLYVRLSVVLLSQQANNVSLGIISHYVEAFVCLHFCRQLYLWEALRHVKHKWYSQNLKHTKISLICVVSKENRRSSWSTRKILSSWFRTHDLTVSCPWCNTNTIVTCPQSMIRTFESMTRCLNLRQIPFHKVENIWNPFFMDIQAIQTIINRTLSLNIRIYYWIKNKNYKSISNIKGFLNSVFIFYCYCYFHNVSADMSSGILRLFVELENLHLLSL